MRTRAASSNLGKALRSPAESEDSSYFGLTAAKRAFISSSWDRVGITAAAASRTNTGFMHKMVSRFLKGVNYGGATQTGDKIDLRMESGLALHGQALQSGPVQEALVGANDDDTREIAVMQDHARGRRAGG